jgi:hypothetical protein
MFGKSSNNTASYYTRDVSLAFTVSGIFVGVAIVFLLLYALGQATSIGFFYSIFGLTTIIAFASTAAGGIIGFLFGIPHSAPANNAPAAPAPSPGGTGNTTPAGNTTSPNTASILSSPPAPSTTTLPASSASQRLSNFVQSTNLEQIADWLTKIFVGVGLTQIHKIIFFFGSLCKSLGHSIEMMIPQNQHPNASAMVGGIIILFSLGGFLIVYLWTYLYLIKIQQGPEIIDKIDDKLQSIDLNNKTAIDLAAQQLDLPPGIGDIPTGHLMQVFANASRNVISSIFHKAASVRKQSWQNKDYNAIQRTIPIFTSLIQLDSKFEYPENFAQLGYALKDQDPPDYNEALKNLDKAITNSDQSRPINKPMVLFNRAYCHIMLDGNPLNSPPPPPGTDARKNEIKADLDEALKDNYVANIINGDPVITAWKAINNIP